MPHLLETNCFLPEIVLGSDLESPSKSQEKLNSPIHANVLKFVNICKSKSNPIIKELQTNDYMDEVTNLRRKTKEPVEQSVNSIILPLSSDTGTNHVPVLPNLIVLFDFMVSPHLLFPPSLVVPPDIVVPSDILIPPDIIVPSDLVVSLIIFIFSKPVQVTVAIPSIGPIYFILSAKIGITSWT